MRIAVAALLGLALLAGCLSGEKSSGPEAPAPAATGPAGVTAIAENGTVAELPAEFLGGFRIDDVHLGMSGPEPNVGITSSGAVFATALQTIVRSTDGGRSY